MTEIHTLTGLAARLREHGATLVEPDITAALALAATVIERRAETVGDQVCRKCGCAEFDPCDGSFGTPCFWAEPSLCSECKEKANDG